MPSTIEAALIVLFGFLPGVPAETVFAWIVGSDWREGQARQVARVLGFSIAGLALYLISAPWFSGPPPRYLFPSYMAQISPDLDALRPLSVALIGHTVGGVVAAAIAATALRLSDKLLRGVAFPGAWDKFVRVCAPGHWVVVATSTGGSFAGWIRSADISVSSEGRDIILAEPARYDEAKKNYTALPYSCLFLPATLVISIGVVATAADQRLTTPGELLFQDHQNDRNEVDQQ